MAISQKTTTLQWIVQSEGETQRLAAAFAGIVIAGDRVHLDGQLGAGKTFFVRALLRALGLPAEVPVTSPTFTLLSEYDLEGKHGDDSIRYVVHGDLYRLGDADELLELGLLELSSARSTLTLLEWACAFEDALGPPDYRIELELAENGEHRLARIGAGTPAASDRLGNLRGLDLAQT